MRSEKQVPHQLLLSCRVYSSHLLSLTHYRRPCVYYVSRSLSPSFLPPFLLPP